MAKSLRTLEFCRAWESTAMIFQRPKKLCRVRFFTQYSILQVSSSCGPTGSWQLSTA